MNMKWSEAKKDYENFLRLEKSLSNNSIVAYINDINKLILFLDREYKKVPPEKVKVSHLNRFIEWINSQGVSPRTQARTISGIKSFYKFLLMEEKITVAPTAMLESPKVGKKLPDILSIEEIDLLINSVDISKPEGLRNRAILETLYSCGLRVSELVELKISDLFLSKNYIKVEGKGGKERLVPISGNAIDEIEKYINEYRNNLKINNADKNILF
ncbi:MAG: tyrosine-type recombinase/integrase, partial [Prolixibacteraceae bacterium]|nr:tyrosine-type recombinase/integrase [Prolixibacteraceae bacterium]